MKTKTIAFSLIIFSYSVLVLSQNIEKSTTPAYLKNQIGLQINPYLSNGTIYSIVYGFRYGYRIWKPVKLGAEISGSFPAFNNSPVPFTDFKAGAFARYTFLPEKRIQIFLEAAPFYAYTYFSEWPEGHMDAIEWSKFGIYIAPGVSLFTKNHREKCLFLSGTKTDPNKIMILQTNRYVITIKSCIALPDLEKYNNQACTAETNDYIS